MIPFQTLLLAALVLIPVPALVSKTVSYDCTKFLSSGASSTAKPQIDVGFDLLYRLKFAEARKQFKDWQQMNPCDPLGYVAAAASYLFEEFNQQQVLTSKFFLNNKRLLGGIEGRPDESRKRNFETEIQQGKELALAQIEAMPEDADALFALATASGLESDFLSILERRQMESLALIMEAEGYARRLLALQPDRADAWVSLGAANYIIGSLPAYKRFILWFGRIRGDKQLGMRQLSIAAEKGHYLKPFAEIFLALAAMRENQEDVARTLLLDLVRRFPENPLYQSELTHLGNPYSVKKDGGH